ncbi:MAG: hypothetical protein QOG56_832 [Solirubrobacteraceae bacterium]|nr:hypothetical protein [Solirubrobacteraceae bacterium]
MPRPTRHVRHYREIGSVAAPRPTPPRASASPSEPSPGAPEPRSSEPRSLAPRASRIAHRAPAPRPAPLRAWRRAPAPRFECHQPPTRRHPRRSCRRCLALRGLSDTTAPADVRRARRHPAPGTCRPRRRAVRPPLRLRPPRLLPCAPAPPPAPALRTTTCFLAQTAACGTPKRQTPTQRGAGNSSQTRHMLMSPGLARRVEVCRRPCVGTGRGLHLPQVSKRPGSFRHGAPIHITPQKATP